jgi:mono/diheme cytochrome c family protein
MRKGRRVALLGACLLVAATGCVDTSTDEATGEHLYRRYCASCHGVSGRGDGPLAASFAPPPSDLTRLAQTAGGRFDETAVMMAIDGRRLGVQHGPRDMPVWGAIFADRHAGERFAIYGATLDARALADYLRTLQHY